MSIKIKGIQFPCHSNFKMVQFQPADPSMVLAFHDLWELWILIQTFSVYKDVPLYLKIGLFYSEDCTVVSFQKAVHGIDWSPTSPTMFAAINSDQIEVWDLAVSTWVYDVILQKQNKVNKHELMGTILLSYISLRIFPLLCISKKVKLENLLL